MTVVYFVRHAEPNYDNHDDLLRELTEKGMKDRNLVTNFLKDKDIQIMLSSPYKRSIDTIKELADELSLPIDIVDDFRERKIDSVWIEDYIAFCKQQWADFDYKLSDGESLGEVQRRNIAALNVSLAKYSGKNIVVGSHGTALSTIINYFNQDYGYADFERIKLLMPWVVKFTFDGTDIQLIETFDLIT